MPQPRHETNHGQREAKLATERGARETKSTTQHSAKDVERTTQRGVDALRRQTERVAETGGEGVRQMGKISAAVFTESARTGSTLADATQDVVSAWARYAETLHDFGPPPSPLNREVRPQQSMARVIPHSVSTLVTTYAAS